MAEPNLAALLAAVELFQKGDAKSIHDALDVIQDFPIITLRAAAHQHAEALQDYLFHPDDDEIVRAAADFLDGKPDA